MFISADATPRSQKTAEHEVARYEPWTRPTRSGMRSPSSSRPSCCCHLQTDTEGHVGGSPGDVAVSLLSHWRNGFKPQMGILVSWHRESRVGLLLTHLQRTEIWARWGWCLNGTWTSLSVKEGPCLFQSDRKPNRVSDGTRKILLRLWFPSSLIASLSLSLMKTR